MELKGQSVGRKIHRQIKIFVQEKVLTVSDTVFSFCSDLSRFSDLLVNSIFNVVRLQTFSIKLSFQTFCFFFLEELHVFGFRQYNIFYFRRYYDFKQSFVQTSRGRIQNCDSLLVHFPAWKGKTQVTPWLLEIVTCNKKLRTAITPELNIYLAGMNVT